MACFYPNGGIAAGHTPCIGSANATHCCASTDACLTNGYCFGASGNDTNTIWRGSCTDSSWLDSSCPRFCSDVYPEASAVIFIGFANSVKLYSGWCCTGHNQTDDTCYHATLGNGEPWTLEDGRVIYDRSNGSTTPPGIIAKSGPAGNATASTSDTGTTVNSFQTPSCPTQTTAGSAQALAPQRTNTSREVAIAAGIGVPLGLMFLVIGFFYSRAIQHSKRISQKLAAVEAKRPASGSKPLPAVKVRKRQNYPVELNPNNLRNELSIDPQIVELPHSHPFT